MPRNTETIRAPGIVQVDNFFCVVTNVKLLGSITIYGASLRIILPYEPGPKVWVYGPRNQPKSVVYGYLGHKRWEVRSLAT